MTIRMLGFIVIVMLIFAVSGAAIKQCGQSAEAKKFQSETITAVENAIKDGLIDNYRGKKAVIIARHLKGDSWQDIGLAVGLPPDHCRYILTRSDIYINGSPLKDIMLEAYGKQLAFQAASLERNKPLINTYEEKLTTP